MAEYKYLVFDGSYFMMRQLSIYKSNYQRAVPCKKSDGSILFDEKGDMVKVLEYNFNYQDLLLSVYWSISKFIREKHSCDKPIIVFDKAPYYKTRDIETYKGDRHYFSEDDLEGITWDENPIDYLQIKEEIRVNRDEKAEAINFMVEHFPKLGIPVVRVQGYEGDDLAYLFARSFELDGKKSAIVSIDGDWSYLINPNVDHIKPNGTVILYDDMKSKSMVDSPNEMELSLYKYKSCMDSLYGSHNNLQCTVNDLAYDEPNHIDIIRRSLSGDDKFLSDRPLFDIQLKSFDIDSYPELDKVKEIIKNINNTEQPMSVEDYRLFCTLTGFQVTEGYYKKTIKCFSQDLYN